MFNTYKNQVEAMLMQDDIEEGLGLTNVVFTGAHVIEKVTQRLFLEVEITGTADDTVTHWVAMKDAKLFFADEQPEGVQIDFPTI